VYFHAAKSLGRNYLGIELDADYHAIATSRLRAVTWLLIVPYWRYMLDELSATGS
jgi:hypothetical protein